MRLWNAICQAAMRNPRQVICENGVQISYEDMILMAQNLAVKIKGERCCAVLCASEMMAAISMLACFAGGITALPLSMRYGKQHCDKIMDHIQPTALITDLSGDLQVVHLYKEGYRTPKSHPAVIMCTSGTTGTPKGVMLSETNILRNVEDICDYFLITNSDTILICRPLYHCAVLTGEFLTSLYKGCKIEFYSQEFNPALIWKCICNVDATVFAGTPTTLRILAQFKRNSMKNRLRVICISGECLSSEVGKQIRTAFSNAEIYSVYGLTEASPRVSYLPPTMFDQHCDCVGYPLKSVSIKIIKQDGSLAHNEEEGVLWVCGDNIMMGYYNDLRGTAKVIKNNWLNTGDIALIDRNGLLKIKGRCDDLIIRAGMNIYPQEIEAAVRKDMRTKEVLVYGQTHKTRGTQIVMKIVGEYTDVEQVKKVCTQHLSSFQMPTKIMLVDSLPKNGSGKVIRK